MISTTFVDMTSWATYHFSLYTGTQNAMAIANDAISMNIIRKTRLNGKFLCKYNTTKLIVLRSITIYISILIGKLIGNGKLEFLHRF